MTKPENKKYMESCGCTGTMTHWVKLCTKHEKETRERHERAARDHKQTEKAS